VRLGALWVERGNWYLLQILNDKINGIRSSKNSEKFKLTHLDLLHLARTG